MQVKSKMHIRNLLHSSCLSATLKSKTGLRCRVLCKSEIPRSTRYALAIGVPVLYLIISVLLLLTIS